MSSYKIKKTAFAIIIATIILYVIIALYGDIEKFSNRIADIDLIFIPFILGAMTLNLFFLGLRFYRLVRILGIKISFRKSMWIYFSSLSFLSTPAGSGQLIKSHLIKKETGEPISKTAPIVLVEKWNELNSVLLLLIFLVIINFLIESQIIIILGAVISLVIVGITRNDAFFSFFKKISERIKFLNSLQESIDNSKNSLKSIMTVKSFLEGFVFTMPAKILEAISVFLAFKAIGIELDIVISTQIFFTAIASGFLSFIPGGIIVTESSMIGLLAKAGVDLAMASAAVIFVRLVTIWYATLLGLVSARFFLKSSI